MIPVNQTIFTKGEGNCFSACIASILELSIEDVPNFFVVAEGNSIKMWTMIGKWLNERGWGMLSIMPPGEIKKAKHIWNRCHYVGLEGCFAIGAVRSQKLPGVLHSIIIGWENEDKKRPWFNPVILHDPRPDNKPYDIVDVIGLDLLLSLQMVKEK